MMWWSILCLHFIFGAFSQEGKAKLHVHVKGVSSSKGTIQIGLFRKEDGFPNKHSQFKGIIVPATKGVSVGVFEHIPPNTYAIAVFHDENGNGKLDKNLVGAPTENYGFSNNARRTFSAPSFEEASFELKIERKIELEVK